MLNDYGKKTLLISLIFLSAYLYYLLGYHVERSQFYVFIICVCLLFVSYYFLYRNHLVFNCNLLIFISIFYRLLFLFSTPILSDDFYRFLWDGYLINSGVNPYQFTPYEVYSSFPNKDYLLSKMNSPVYYSVYPPGIQFVFIISTYFFPNSIIQSIIFLRSIIVLFEIGTIIIMIKLLNKLKMPKSNVLLYAFNPLVIIELSGNLHIEGLWIFAIVLSAYFLNRNKLWLSSVLWAIGASIKLIPIIIIPVFFRYFKLNKAIKFILVSCLIFFCSFLYFYESPIIFHNFLQSIKLYSVCFEFNASVYYLVREIGEYLLSYNPIQHIGPVFSIIAFLGAFIILISKPIITVDLLFTQLLLALSWYYIFSLVVHPWYIAPIVAFSVFTRFKYGILWSFLVMLSYFAYNNDYYNESYILIFIEYIVLFFFILNSLFFNLNNRLTKWQ